MGAFTAFLDLALGVANPVLGLVASGVGLGAVFLASALVVLGSAAMALLIAARKAKLVAAAVSIFMLAAPSARAGEPAARPAPGAPRAEREVRHMNASIPEQMKAAAFDRYGGPEVLHAETLPVPRPGPRQILVRLDAAGIGVWDPEVRSGELELGRRRFPQVIGNDGAGEVVALGGDVRRFRVGDRVYAYSFEGGFYAEYVAVDEDAAAPIPQGLSTQEAGALGADGVTALRGLDDQLHLSAGQALLIYGASGGIGHLAVQLAKRMGARVLAVASGPDGVELVRKLGADAAVDGKRDDVARAARDLAPDGLDAALVLVHGASLEPALRTIRKGGRIAHPNGVEPTPEGPPGVQVVAYDGEPGRDALERLNRLIASGPFHVEVGRTYPLEDAARAHQEVGQHHLGKLALRMH